MTTTNKSSAVLGMVCEEISGVVNNFTGSVDETVPDRISVYDSSVALKTIGLRHHAHDTASEEVALHVPACYVNDATGPCDDVSSSHCYFTTLYCNHNIHNFICTQTGRDVIWTPNMDNDVIEYMSKRYDSLRVAVIGRPPDPLITWHSLPGSLLHVPAVDILNRWRVLRPVADSAESWTSGSYAESVNSSSGAARTPTIGLPEFFSSSITKDLLCGFANVIESDQYFWSVILVRLYKARGDNLAKVLVLSDILTRHSNMIRSFANRGELSVTHINETTDLVNDVSRALDDLDHTEFVLRDDVDDIYHSQAGLGDFFEQSSTFSSAFGTATAIFKYLSDRNVVFPMVKLLVSGTLFAFGTHVGDPEVFTSENIASATKTVYSYFKTGTVGAFVQVFDSMRKLLSTWINSDSGSSLSEHLKCTNKAEQYFQLGVELLKTQSIYATENVPAQRVYLQKVHDFLKYCREHLGAGIHVSDPWRAGMVIISDPNRLTWYKTTWRVLEAFYSIEMGKSIREQPCVFLFSAGSSVGKTTMQHVLNQMLLTRHLDVTADQVKTFTYAWPSGDPKFANGATNSILTVLMDDIGAKRPDVTKSTGGDPMVKELLGLLNMFPYSPDMADLELKGKIYMAPKIVICSTNCPKLGLNCVYNEPAAVQRRIGGIIHVTVAPEFATKYETMDETKLNQWCRDNPGGIPNAWRMRIEKLQADNRTYNMQGSGIKCERSYMPPMKDPPMDTHTFLKWADATFKAHSTLHTSILETLNVPYKFDTIFGGLDARNDHQGEGDVWHDSAESFESQDGPIVSQSGSDLYAMPRWSFMNTTFTDDGVNSAAGVNLWVLLLTAWASIMAALRITALLNYGYQRLREAVTLPIIDRYRNLTCVRAFTTAATGYRLVSAYSDKKRKALEWLDNNKRVLVIISTLAAAGAIATYVCRKRKSPKVASQVGDESTSRGGYVVRTSPHDTLSRWSQLGGSKLKKESMYGLSHQSSSATGSNVVSLTADHCVQVTFECKKSSYSCRANMIGGREMILNRHSLPQYCKRRSVDSDWDSYTMTVHGVGYSNHGSGNGDLTIDHTQIVGNYIPNRDLAGITLPAAGCRPYRDIKPYYLNAPTALWTKDFSYTETLMPAGTVMSFGQKIPSGIEIKPCGYVVPSVAARPDLMTSPQLPIRSIKPNDKVHDIASSVLCYQLDTTTVTLPGYCGSFYYLYERGNNIAAIGGIHLGQLVEDEWKKVVLPVYRSDLDILFPRQPQYIAPAMGSFADVVEETEEQSGSISQKTHTCSYTLQRGETKFKINLQNSPYLDDNSYWAETTLEYMKRTMGVTVNPNSYAVVGNNNGGGKLKSGFVESPLSNAISNIDPDGLPDVTSTKKKVNSVNKKTRDEHARHAIAGIMCHKDYDSDLAEEFYDAAESYFDSIVEFDKAGDGCVFKYVHPVSAGIAINGSSFDNDGVTFNHKAMEPIDMNTSPGHPYNIASPSDVQEGMKHTGKHPWFTCTRDCTGKASYKMGPELAASHEELHTMFKRDHDTKVMFGAVLKDEPKDEMKPTRVIMVGPLCMTILCRQYLLTICRTMQLNPFVFGAVVGLDATCVQWDQIFNFICGSGAFKNFTFDGDYKNYDKSLFQEVTDATRWVIFMLCKMSGAYTEQDLFVVQSILQCLLSPVVDIFGVVYWFRSLNTSGNSLTTQINCIANMLFIWVVWTRRMKADLGADYDVKFSRKMFERFVSVVTYGDDHLVGCKYADLLNCRVMQEGLKDLIIYTDARKSLDTQEFTPHEELIFLGRAMIRDETGSILCPLEFKRIMKTFHFFRVQAGIQFEQMIADLYRGLLLEIHFHGRKVYEIFYSRLVTAMANHYGLQETLIEDLYFMDNKGVRLTYDYFRGWWVDKKDRGFISDPKYMASVQPLSDDDKALYQRYCECKARNASGNSTNVA